jgi:hypothetical protein
MECEKKFDGIFYSEPSELCNDENNSVIRSAMDALRNSKKIILLAVAILFLFTFFNLILDAPRTLSPPPPKKKTFAVVTISLMKLICCHSLENIIFIGRKTTTFLPLSWNLS